MIEEGTRKNALVAMMTARGELIGLGRMAMSADRVLSADTGMAVETTRVIMDPGHYPRMWHYSTDIDGLRDPDPFVQ